MPFVKALLWVLLLVALVIFAVNNWVPVTIALWGDQMLDTKLPVLIIGALLIGWLPTWLFLKGSRWRSRRQIRALEAGQGTQSYTPYGSNPAQPANTAGGDAV